MGYAYILLNRWIVKAWKHWIVNGLRPPVSSLGIGESWNCWSVEALNCWIVEALNCESVKTLNCQRSPAPGLQSWHRGIVELCNWWSVSLSTLNTQIFKLWILNESFILKPLSKQHRVCSFWYKHCVVRINLARCKENFFKQRLKIQFYNKSLTFHWKAHPESLNT